MGGFHASLSRVALVGCGLVGVDTYLVCYALGCGTATDCWVVGYRLDAGFVWARLMLSFG